MDSFGKGETLTNRDVNKYVHTMRNKLFVHMEHFCDLFLFRLYYTQHHQQTLKHRNRPTVLQSLGINNKIVAVWSLIVRAVTNN